VTDSPALTLQTFPDVNVAKPNPDDIRLWSVTTILKVLSSPGLEYWQKEEVSKAFVSIRKSLCARVDEDGEEAMIKWGINAPYRPPKVGRTASDLGTAFHEVAEQIAITGKVPAVDDELRPLVDQYERWLQKAQPTFLAAEMPVYDTQFGFAGTTDGQMMLQGTPLIHDYKTSKKSWDKKGKRTHPWPESALQLAAYRGAEWAVPVPPRRWTQNSRRYYLFGNPERDNATPVPPVDGGIVIHVTPEHCDAYVVRCDEPVREAFLYVLEASRWQNDLSRTVIGDILEFEEVV
jgi:hypothetical protein